MNGRGSPRQDQRARRRRFASTLRGTTAPPVLPCVSATRIHRGSPQQHGLRSVYTALRHSLREVAMPWLKTDPMIERLKFVQDALGDRFTMAEVCARYAVSRPTGYKLIAR